MKLCSAFCTFSALLLCSSTVGATAEIAGNDSTSAMRKLKHHFTDIDTSYIEEQHFNWAVMAQSTWAYSLYTIINEEKQSIRFQPESQIKIGPYFGYRWMFAGYTFDISHLSSDNRKEYDVSLYSNLAGIDLYYRKSGKQYYISSANFRDGTDTEPLIGSRYSGFKSSVRGFNFYYIFNHHKFSYPTAFSQSTVQRRSAGSVMAGISHTRHTLSVDWDQFYELIDDKLGAGTAASVVDTTMHSTNIKYDSYAISGGYAYNWVFARNWLLSAGALLGLAYNQSRGSTEKSFINFRFRNFSIHNFNFDGIFRLGLVWNNTRWFAGLSGLVHSFNYNKSAFKVNNSFGTVNLYFGVNFGRKKNKQKK